jgi:hypothetical protein
MAGTPLTRQDMARDLHIHIDPQLEHQLQVARGGRDVGATFTLKLPKTGVLSATETETTVRALLQRASRRARVKPSDVNVFANIQSFAVQAPPVLVREILQEPEIGSAMANEQGEELEIAPVTEREVSLPSPGRLRKAAKRRSR